LKPHSWAVRSFTRAAVVAIACLLIGGTANAQTDTEATRNDGLTAWEAIYSALVSPRCLNCHTATAHPQQGDQRQPELAPLWHHSLCRDSAGRPPAR
jgi:mono/diheme cytochrome c family protein